MDHNLFLKLFSLTEHSDVLNIMFSFFAKGFGVVLFSLVVLYIIIKTKPHRQEVLRIGRLVVVMFSALAFSRILKLVIARPRPFEVLDIDPIILYGSGDSFPSGHATFYMALAIISFEYLPKSHAWTVTILAFVISISRIIIGVHFPTDIIMGWFIALLTALFIRAIWPVGKISGKSSTT